jgi:hypothetical protein
MWEISFPIPDGSSPAGPKESPRGVCAQGAYEAPRQWLLATAWATSKSNDDANRAGCQLQRKGAELLLTGVRNHLHGIRLSYDGTIPLTGSGTEVDWLGTNLPRHHIGVHHGVASFVDPHGTDAALTTLRAAGGDGRYPVDP